MYSCPSFVIFTSSITSLGYKWGQTICKMIQENTKLRKYVCTNVRTYIRRYICINVSIRTWAYMDVSVCVRTYVRTHIQMNAWIYGMYVDTCTLYLQSSLLNEYLA